MKTNYHTHTQRCQHAQGSEEDYVLSAIASHVDILGFSDHAPFPDYDFGLRMPYEELDSYLQAIDLLKEKYSTDIILLKALEIEYMPKYLSYYEKLLNQKKLDYLLLGEHIYMTDSGIMYNITSAPDTTQYVEYAKAVVAAMKTGLFRAVAHPDLFMMNPYSWDRNCDTAVELIIENAMLTDTILEFNATGFRRGIKSYPDGDRYMYPHRLFWEQVAQTDIHVVIGSDCHNPKELWDKAMDESYSYLKNIGIEPIQTL